VNVREISRKLACPSCFEITTECDPKTCAKECISICNSHAIKFHRDKPEIDIALCDMCSECVFACPNHAIERGHLRFQSNSLICLNCSAVYAASEDMIDLRPKTTTYDYLLQFYEETELEVQKTRESWGGYQRKAKDLAMLCKGMTFNEVVDAGCGLGIVLDEFSKSMGIAVENRVGCDLSFNTLKYAKNKFPNIMFIRADVENLPFKNKAFELAICTDVLEHVRNFRKAFKEINRISNYAGVKVPLEDSLFSLIPKVWAKLLRQKGAKVGHIQQFRLSYLLSMFEQDGCQVLNSCLRNQPLRYGWKLISTMRLHGKIYFAIYFTLAAFFFRIMPRDMFTRFFDTMNFYTLLKCREFGSRQLNMSNGDESSRDQP